LLRDPSGSSWRRNRTFTDTEYRAVGQIDPDSIWKFVLKSNERRAEELKDNVERVKP